MECSLGSSQSDVIMLNTAQAAKMLLLCRFFCVIVLNLRRIRNGFMIVVGQRATTTRVETGIVASGCGKKATPTARASRQAG